MKTQVNTNAQQDQEIDMEEIHRAMAEFAEKNILTEKEIEDRERFKNAVFVLSEEVIQSIRENDERAKKASTK